MTDTVLPYVFDDDGNRLPDPVEPYALDDTSTDATTTDPPSSDGTASTPRVAALLAAFDDVDPADLAARIRRGR